jgi:hypothetical protein
MIPRLSAAAVLLLMIAPPLLADIAPSPGSPEYK